MKLTIALLFLFFSIGSYGQNTEETLITQTISNNHVELTFINVKTFDESKVDRFTSRLENYYQEVEKIEFYSNDNTFYIRFTSSALPEDVRLKEILTHFNIYNYSILAD